MIDGEHNRAQMKPGNRLWIEFLEQGVLEMRNLHCDLSLSGPVIRRLPIQPNCDEHMYCHLYDAKDASRVDLFRISDFAVQ